jgi:hypothetical protein
MIRALPPQSQNTSAGFALDFVRHRIGLRTITSIARWRKVERAGWSD